uniref:Uncharacterized protein n=1 Tax=Arundo donax TaxID=35708 RepID=A0A0A9BG36_ARUDO
MRRDSASKALDPSDCSQQSLRVMYTRRRAGS